MKIAVIDSGVNGDREELKKYKIHHVSTEYIVEIIKITLDMVRR